jgi:hypothetical protein
LHLFNFKFYMNSKWKLPVLILGDWLALSLFVFLGQMEHELVAGNYLPRLLQGSAIIALPWTAVALLLGACRMKAGMTAASFLGRSLTAWLIAAPLALILRAYLNGQATIIVIFMVITIGLGGIFLLAWRGLYFFVWRRLGRKSASHRHN